MTTTNWLIVESFANWEVDQANKFSHFGITRRFEKIMSTAKPNDKLFTYVIGKSCFSDIREVTRPGNRKLAMGGDYELSLPLCVDTRPILILKPAQWLPIKDIKDQLLLTAAHQHWGQVFRSAPRVLDPHDAELLDLELHRRAAQIVDA